MAGDFTEMLGWFATFLERFVEEYAPPVNIDLLSPSRRILIFISTDNPDDKRRLAFMRSMNMLIDSVFDELKTLSENDTELTRERISEIICDNSDMFFLDEIQAVFKK